jgi:hypothetical protein
LACSHEEARRKHALRPRQQTEERQPEDDEEDAGELGLTGGAQNAADCRCSGTESDEHEREAGDERHARKRDAPRDARLTETIGLDRRDGREVAGYEREHAGSHDREEPCKERDRQLRSHRAPSDDAAPLLGREHQARGRTRPQPRLDSLGQGEGGPWRSVIAGQK